MTCKTMTAFGAALVLGASTSIVVSPAFAAVSQQVRQACERKADQVTPALRAPEREAFIANCLADATADTAGTKKKKPGGKY
jgi:hypothetical protein